MGEKNIEKQTQDHLDLLQIEVKEKTIRILEQVEDRALLERIYRFALYIYIHRT